MKRLIVQNTSIHDLKIIKRQTLSDERGYLERMFCNEELKSIIGQRNIVQINHTLTIKPGTVRGLHFQYPPHTEMKFVSCLHGEVFDVAVDLRKNSSTFLQWHAEVISKTNLKTMIIPEGFAHGFQTLSKNCELLYIHTAAYSPQAEYGLNALDTKLAIDWPLPVSERSVRDQHYKMLTPEFSGLEI